MISVPIVTLNPTEQKQRGLLYGKAPCYAIENTMKIYQDLFGAYTGYIWERIIFLIDIYVHKVKLFAPNLIKKVKGIAESGILSFFKIYMSSM